MAIGSSRCGWMFGSWMLELEIMGKLEAIWISEMRAKSGIFWRLSWMDPFSVPRLGQTGTWDFDGWPWQAESLLSRQVEALVTLCPITL